MKKKKKAKQNKNEQQPKEQIQAVFFCSKWDMISAGKRCDKFIPSLFAGNQPNIRKSDVTADKVALYPFS